MGIDEILQIQPYSLNKIEKTSLLNSFLHELTMWHYKACPEYKMFLDSLGHNELEPSNYESLPFLPVRLFKMMDLLSINKKEVLKTMTSSGTTGQAVSRIFLDRNTSVNQSKALTKIVTSYIGKQRSPMIIIDSPKVVQDRNLFSARGAGLLGFSIFGNKKIYALNENMELKIDEIESFIRENQNERILLFGFTFIVWQHFIKEILKKNLRIDLSNSILIHGGGWKKLINEAISSLEFKKQLENVCGIRSVHDYYGMVEQTGSIYMECEKGYLHAPIYSDIIIRRPLDFSVAEFGERGIIQTLSVLPYSYPGHSLLTEDEGILYGEDDCQCGRLGKYFKIIGRLNNAELRGCSDVYASKF
jgi:phenylacetate-coenzyme A ligase PaaK-like adenylate-forming protein